MMGEMLFWDIWNIAYRRKRGADLISKSMQIKASFHKSVTVALHILTTEGAFSLEVQKQKLIRKEKFFFFFCNVFVFIFICPTARKVPSLALFVPSDGGEILPLHCLNKKVQEDKMSALSCLQMSHHNPEQRLQPKFGSRCPFFRLHRKSSLILNTAQAC